MYQKFISDECNKCSFIKMNKTSKILVHVIHFVLNQALINKKVDL